MGLELSMLRQMDSGSKRSAPSLSLLHIKSNTDSSRPAAPYPVISHSLTCKSLSSIHACSAAGSCLAILFAIVQPDDPMCSPSSQVSFGSILTPIGVFFLTYGFGAFFQILPGAQKLLAAAFCSQLAACALWSSVCGLLPRKACFFLTPAACTRQLADSLRGLVPGADIAAILLIYGFPITLLGFALSYAQLKPVPCRTTAEALRLRDAQATDIQKQVCRRCTATDTQHKEGRKEDCICSSRLGLIRCHTDIVIKPVHLAWQAFHDKCATPIRSACHMNCTICTYAHAVP